MHSRRSSPAGPECVRRVTHGQRFPAQPACRLRAENLCVSTETCGGGGGGGKSVTSCELKQPSDWKCFMALSYCCRDLRQLVTNEIIIPDGAA